jgi:hypothetical protein
VKGELSWFRLQFPRELSAEAVTSVLSALSGADWNTRFVFDLFADHDGIQHRIAVSSLAVDILLAEFRAAIPSLRGDEIAEPAPVGDNRLLWQLVPAAAALRVDNLEAIAASLLASCFPLDRNEAIRLAWRVRPGVRPALTVTPEERASGRVRALRAKLALSGVRAYGELSASATSRQRARHLTHHVAAVLRSLSTPYGHLAAEPPLWGTAAWLIGRRGRYFSVSELAAVIGWPVGASLDLPGLRLGSAKRLLPSAELSRQGRVLGTSNFAEVTRQVAITPTASTRGAYILGPTGSGKTALLKNLIRDDLEQNRGLAVIETNGDLTHELLDIIPDHRIDDVIFLDPTDSEYAVGFNPLVGSGDPSLIADQIIELLERLWKSFWGPRTAQLAHMALLALASQRNTTLLDVSRLLADAQFRAGVIGRLDDPVGLAPDWAWFSGLSDAERDNVTAPLRNKLRSFTARPAIRAIIGQAEPAITMRQIVAEKKILLAHLPKGLLGAETVKLLGCLLLTSLWQTATERARLPLSARHYFGVVVDEVQDFTSAPIPWAEMFAQGRKYGLAVTVAHQNLAQIEHRLLETLHANARSKAVFALSATDARIMERLFAPSLSVSDLMALDAYSIAAIVALDDGSVARPVTLVTPPPPPVTGKAEQVLAASRSNYARPRAEVEAELRDRLIPKLPSGPLGSKPRSS